MFSPEDPNGYFVSTPCVDCGRSVFKARTATVDARCEKCWKTYTGATYDGTPTGRWYPVVPRVERGER